MIKYFALFVVLGLLWSGVAFYLGLYGWWMQPVAASGDAPAFFQWAANEIETENKGSAAFSLIENGEVVDEHFQPAARTNGDTLFPTASFSKFITALAVLQLSERGQVDLDEPVSRYLTRWQLPDSSFDHDKVTIRRLLSHTAGLTDGLGFGDYRADETVPETLAELNAPRASGGRRVIHVGIEPGTEYAYSGGGYLMLQGMVEELTGLGFAGHVQAALLQPLGLSRSTYDFYAQQQNATASYNVDGSEAEAFQYASSAATGFNSSAHDLVLLTRALVQADPRLLSPDMLKAMRQPHGFVMGTGIWGLGTILYAPTETGDMVFGHDGANDPAINSTLRVNPDTGDAIVVLVSGHPSLATKIGSEWVLWQTGVPDVLAVERALESSVVPLGIGLGLILLVVVGVGFRGRT